MGLLLAVVLSFVPAAFCCVVVYWLDRFEKEPKLLVGAVFLWGAFVATVVAGISQLVLGGAVRLATRSNATADVLGSTVFAPITEEALKGFAVLIVFVLFRHEFDSALDGIVYAATTALGFAATENVLYLFFHGYQQHGLEGLTQLFVVRVVMGAWDHPFYTAFTGLGLAAARLSTSLLVRLTAPLMGLGVAMGFHALHNLFATLSGGFVLLMLLVDWSGWLFMALVVVVAIVGEVSLLTRELREEIDYGVISTAQYHTACSVLGQMGARLGALFDGRFLATRRFYHLCAELAHKKQHLASHGDERGNAAAISCLRDELGRLRPLVRA